MNPFSSLCFFASVGSVTRMVLRWLALAQMDWDSAMVVLGWRLQRKQQEPPKFQELAGPKHN